MECVGKTGCAATYKYLLPAGKLLPEFRFLELAKGFEPLTL